MHMHTHTHTHLLRRLAPVSALLASVAFVLAAWSGAPAAAAVDHSSHVAHAAQLTSPSQAELRAGLRKLWEDHITWTRLFVVSDLGGLPDLQPTTNRLLQNQADIGNAVRPFYGDAAADQLTGLLRDHILIAADVVNAAKAGDQAGLQSSMGRWQANADDIGGFLGAANPDSWPADEMKAMMRQHLDLTTAEVVARLKGDWAGDIAAYEKVHAHILMLSDQLADGIIAQFPDDFAS